MIQSSSAGDGSIKYGSLFHRGNPKDGLTVCMGAITRPTLTVVSKAVEVTRPAPMRKLEVASTPSRLTSEHVPY